MTTKEQLDDRKAIFIGLMAAALTFVMLHLLHWFAH
jgi:hypothetical protein